MPMGMVKRLSRLVLYGMMGWKTEVTEPHPDKFVICLAPHTSNWDFIIGLLYSRAEGMKINFLMKKEWFFWPLGVFFRHWGGIPVNRGRHTSMTDWLAGVAQQRDTFKLCITPEGTRSLNADWKKGFYFISQKAGIPILLYGVDYEKRKIVCTKTFVPTGDLEGDMRQIKLYFKDFKGKNPELFTIGEI